MKIWTGHPDSSTFLFRDSHRLWRVKFSRWRAFFFRGSVCYTEAMTELIHNERNPQELVEQLGELCDTGASSEETLGVAQQLLSSDDGVEAMIADERAMAFLINLNPADREWLIAEASPENAGRVFAALAQGAEEVSGGELSLDGELAA